MEESNSRATIESDGEALMQGQGGVGGVEVVAQVAVTQLQHKADAGWHNTHANQRHNIAMLQHMEVHCFIAKVTHNLLRQLWLRKSGMKTHTCESVSKEVLRKSNEIQSSQVGREVACMIINNNTEAS